MYIYSLNKSTLGGAEFKGDYLRRSVGNGYLPYSAARHKCVTFSDTLQLLHV